MKQGGFLAKGFIKGKIHLLTGLHIGGSQTGIDIGGVDSDVIKDAKGRPYIPGSTLKGKMRNLMSRLKNKEPDHPVVRGEIHIHMCVEEEEVKKCPVCTIFGTSSEKGRVLTRLLVRDAFLIPESLEDVQKDLDLEWTEVKFENVIDRITSRANPRQLERVPEGAEFSFEMAFTFYTEDDYEYMKDFLLTMRLLENDYIGGSGSRGYGRICWEDLAFEYVEREKYLEAEVEKETFESLDIDGLIKKYEDFMKEH